MSIPDYFFLKLLIFTVCCQQALAVKCFYCRQKDAWMPGGIYSSLGCDAPAVKHQTKECKVACRQQIFLKEVEDQVILGPGRNGTVKKNAGESRYRGCEDHAHLAGTCRLNRGEKLYYDCFCSQPLCNGLPPPCSWMRNANPEDLHPSGCIEDDEEGMGEDLPKSMKTGEDEAEESATSDSTEIQQREDKPRTHGVHCYKCSDTEAMGDVEGCDAAHLKEGTRHCAGICKQQILRTKVEQDQITRYPGDAYSRDCEDDSSLAGSCKVINKTMYECYCSRDRCNGSPPPCEWMVKANPKERHPPGCIGDLEDMDDVAVEEPEPEGEPEAEPERVVVTTTKRPPPRKYAPAPTEEPENEKIPEEGAMHCHRCTPVEAFRSSEDYKAFAEGCEAPDIRGKSKHCKAICKQQIFRKPVERKIQVVGEKNTFITVTRYIGDAHMRGCENDASLAGTCKVLNDTLYECYCGHNMCNGNPPPCSWMTAANPQDTNPVGCTNDDDDNEEVLVVTRKPETEPKNVKKAPAPVGKGGKVETAPAPKPGKAPKVELDVEGGLKCYRCSKTDAYRKNGGTQANVEGCEAAELKSQTRLCPGVCKQQILRLPQNENVLQKSISEKHVVVTRYAGDSYLRGCGNESTSAGTCRTVGNVAYECYCSQELCNGLPPPCSWMRKANPKDANPMGCIEDDEDGMGEAHFEAEAEEPEEPVTVKTTKKPTKRTTTTQATQKPTTISTTTTTTTPKPKVTERVTKRVTTTKKPPKPTTPKPDGLRCFRCSKTEAFRSNNGTEPNLGGCESPEIRSKTRQCFGVCKQQVFRVQHTESVPAGPGTNVMVKVSRYPGDVYLRGCGNESALAGTCKLTGKLAYECYCSQELCNGIAPPCSWMRKANPEDKNPVGCFEDDDSELGKYTDDIEQVPETEGDGRKVRTESANAPPPPPPARAPAKEPAGTAFSPATLEKLETILKEVLEVKDAAESMWGEILEMKETLNEVKQNCVRPKKQ